MLSSFFEEMQKIGKSLMLPVSVLPIAGLLLGIGSSNLSWIATEVSLIMAQSGGAIFGNLPLIFAIGVAIGLTKNDGVASIAAIVGFVVLLATMGVVAKITGVETKAIMGIDSIETGVFGGIISGLISAFLFNRYYKIELHPYLGFFSGKRFVPIVTAFTMIFIGILMSFIWPPIQGVIDGLSQFAVTENPNAMVFTYGLVERLLIPFGLHHIWNVPFFFEIGEFVNQSGEVFHGDIKRFFAGDPTSGFLGGGYLFKMFGLPAAAIAMWHCAKKEKKKLVASIMISAAVTSFLTGITEPIEFSFLFVAPFLYLIHAVLSGCCFLVMNIMGAKLGFTFSHGLIDYALYYHMDTKPWLVLILGPITAIIYYLVFKFAITKFNLMTPGREEEEGEESNTQNISKLEKAKQVLMALGGKNNIKSLDACITRLRVSVYKPELVSKDQLISLGANGVLFIGQSIQAIFGTFSDILKSEIEELMNSSPKEDQKNKNEFISPMSGEILPLNEIPDKAFSEGMMGPGFGINPKDGKVYAPFDGEIAFLFKTNHAIGIKSPSGQEVLIHFGIDTVKLGGEGFNALVKQGDHVKQGDLLLDINLNNIINKIPSSITPIIFTNYKGKITLNSKKDVKQGERGIVDFK